MLEKAMIGILDVALRILFATLVTLLVHSGTEADGTVLYAISCLAIMSPLMIKAAKGE